MYIGVLSIGDRWSGLSGMNERVECLVDALTYIAAHTYSSNTTPTNTIALTLTILFLLYMLCAYCVCQSLLYQSVYFANLSSYLSPTAVCAMPFGVPTNVFYNCVFPQGGGRCRWVRQDWLGLYRNHTSRSRRGSRCFHQGMHRSNRAFSRSKAVASSRTSLPSTLAALSAAL